MWSVGIDEAASARKVFETEILGEETKSNKNIKILGFSKWGQYTELPLLNIFWRSLLKH